MNTDRTKAARTRSARAAAEPTGDAVGVGVTLGLFAAWAVHDAEEVAMVPRWTRTRIPEMRERMPDVPEAVWERLESLDGRHFATAVGMMAAIVGAAAVDGYRTGGRSAFYQHALTGFGLHGFIHLAQAAVTRGYTPGSATSPLLVIPFTAWARRRLRAAGLLHPTRPRDLALGLGAAAAATAASHFVAGRLLRAKGGRKPQRT
ncbi:HXXEE domain-containing protein [Streptomyces oryzae]|uniref:HXXEE domain-containing protein n=1 Tax=Streptomyces oryzae TaxID=1434886 RepID=A0ABS3X5A5_9ACTN|nr:HXXEE domain-containing protein [Streptomyces oryzae]MBO8190565.1 HXXEE domain-containing protein [Streptomyces oryzae]